MNISLSLALVFSNKVFNCIIPIVALWHYNQALQCCWKRCREFSQKCTFYWLLMKLKKRLDCHAFRKSPWTHYMVKKDLSEANFTFKNTEPTLTSRMTRPISGCIWGKHALVTLKRALQTSIFPFCTCDLPRCYCGDEDLAVLHKPKSGSHVQ